MVLPAPSGPMSPKSSPGADREVDPLQRPVLSEVLDESARLDHRGPLSVSTATSAGCPGTSGSFHPATRSILAEYTRLTRSFLVSTGFGVNSASGEISATRASKVLPGNASTLTRALWPVPHAAELRLRNEGAHVEPVEEGEGQAGLARREQEPRLGHAVKDDAVGRGADLRLLRDRLRLFELDLRAVGVEAGPGGLLAPRALDREAQALLARLQGRLRALEVRLRPVVVADGSDLLVEQHVLPLELPFRERNGRAAVADLGLGGRDLGPPAARGKVLVLRLGRPHVLAVALDGERRLAEVEAREHVARLDAVPFADENLDHAAGDLRCEVDERRLDAPAQVDDPSVVPAAAGDQRRRQAHGKEQSSNPSHRVPPAAATVGPSSANWM